MRLSPRGALARQRHAEHLRRVLAVLAEAGRDGVARHRRQRHGAGVRGERRLEAEAGAAHELLQHDGQEARDLVHRIREREQHGLLPRAVPQEGEEADVVGVCGSPQVSVRHGMARSGWERRTRAEVTEQDGESEDGGLVLPAAKGEQGAQREDAAHENHAPRGARHTATHQVKEDAGWKKGGADEPGQRDHDLRHCVVLRLARRCDVGAQVREEASVGEQLGEDGLARDQAAAEAADHVEDE